MHNSTRKKQSKETSWVTKIVYALTIAFAFMKIATRQLFPGICFVFQTFNCGPEKKNNCFAYDSCHMHKY